MKLRHLGVIFLMLFFAACGGQSYEEQYVKHEKIEEAEENTEIEEAAIVWQLADFAYIRDESGIGRIHLYGEFHGNPGHHAKQFELWYNYYHSYGMRHLFIEAPLFTAELLNIWMQEDNNELLYYEI